MARLPRLAIAGYVHHLLQRGHNGQAVFRDADDRAHFVELLRESAAAESVAVHGYALLDDELQLLATPGQHAGALSRLMQAVARRHGARFNRRHGHAGSIWAGRFRCTVIDPTEWLLPCLRFIETAPVRRGQAASPEADRWTSAGHHLGLRVDPLVSEHARFWLLGNTPFEREAGWASFLRASPVPAELEAIAAAVEHGWALGSTAFVIEARQATTRRLERRRPGRPRSAAKAVPI